MRLKQIVAAALLAAAVTAAPKSADAATIQLGFILDRSGSIGPTSWNTIVNGLASAVNTYIPVGGADVYEISVVTFATTASINIANFVVNTEADRTMLAAQISALTTAFVGGGTNFAPAFNAMLDALNNTTLGPTTQSFVNFATDGVEGDTAAAIIARNALIAAGVDNISIEAIGAAVDAFGLQTSYCYPGPCDTTIPYNFPAQGFYVSVANADAYAAAIANKIQVVTGQDPVVPEPATLTLLGLGMSGLAGRAWRKRKTRT